MAGGLVALLAIVPLYALLPGRETGLAGEMTAEVVKTFASLAWSGFLIALGIGIIAARIVRPEPVLRRLAAVGEVQGRGNGVGYAALLGIGAVVIVSAFSLGVLGGKPNLIDAMSQLVHARFLAAGRLAGPAGDLTAFWQLQTSLVTPAGWVSHFPPGHAALLALGLRLGAAWLVGPAMAGFAVFFTTIAAERLLPDDRVVARLGGLLLLCSPYFLCLAGSYMNHVTAAAFIAIAVYCALRARDGHGAWALAAGAAAAAAFATRPLSALVTCGLVTFGVWLTGDGRTRGAWWWATRTAALLAGAIPIGAALGLYNTRFFGSPLRFGYSAAYTPAVGLGFHRDPWGNLYGPIESLLYTSADLTALNLELLEWPVPVIVLAGVFLLIARRLSPGQRVIAVWALAPVAANAFYWHHGIFMGPRMLNEAAPAWALLGAIAMVGTVRMIPAQARIAPHFSPRLAATVVLLTGAAIGLVWLAPRRALSYGGDYMASSRIAPPRTDEPSLVFVHGGWTARIGSRLAARGMALDSIETLLRQNSTCDAQRYLDALAAREAGRNGTPLPDLDWDPRASGFPRRVEIAPGDPIRLRGDERWTPECARQAASDRNGIIDVSPLVWQGDLPGLEPNGAMYVRDLGPELNRRLIERHSDRRPAVFLTPTADSDPVVVPYEQGMTLLWGGDAGTASR